MNPMIGDTLKALRIADVSPQGMKAWAGFLRDPNPLHLDPRAVAAKGLGERVINQGPANLAYVISMLQSAFPGARIDTLEVRYVDNVFGGEAVEASGRVLELSGGDDAPQIKCEVWLRAEARGPVITGTATLTLAAIR